MLAHGDLLDLAASLSADSPFSPSATHRILRYGAPLGCRISHHHTLSRCMDQLRDRIRATDRPAPATGKVVWADRLTASQGRFHRHWFAPEGGLHMAFLWADTLLPEWGRFLPFAVGIACCETLCAFGAGACLKWVNDILVQGRKIGGVLTETIIGAPGERYFLVGIGININVVEFPEELRSRATSLRLETGQPHGVTKIFAHLLARLQWNIGLLGYSEEQWLAGRIRFEENPVLLRWRELADSPGKKVMFGYDVQKAPLYRGTVLNIDRQGGLILCLEDGSKITEYAGEIEYLDAPDAQA